MMRLKISVFLFSILSLIALLVVLFIFSTWPARAAIEGDVVITEVDVRGDPEWVELLNTTESDISLYGWRIQDFTFSDGEINGTADTNIENVTIPAHGIVVIPTTTAGLNNTGDAVILFDGEGNQISSVQWDIAPPLEGILPSPAPSEGEVIALGPDFVTWSATETSTKGWFNDAGAPEAAPLLSDIDALLSEQGIESNIGELDNPSVTPSTESDGALYFEKVDEETAESVGKIVFESELNLSDESTVNILQSLGEAMELTEGHIKFDSDTAEAMAAVGAKIYMYGLDDMGFTQEPSITVTDDEGNPLDSGDILSDIYYTQGGGPDGSGELSFAASHFTQFDIDNTPPSVAAAIVTGPNTIRVAFSEPVNTNAYNYENFSGDMFARVSSEDCWFNYDFEVGGAETIELTFSCNEGDALDESASGTFDVSDVTDNDAFQIEPTTVTVQTPPQTVYVDGSFSSGEENGGRQWRYDAFDSIQDALDTVAEGGTVNIATGTYDSSNSYTLNKAVSLIGPGTGASADEAYVNVMSCSYVFSIEASDVTISGLVIRELNEEASSDTDYAQCYPAIRVIGSGEGDATVTGTTISGNEIAGGGSNGGSGGGGIQLRDDTASTTISNNKIYANGTNGISVSGSVNNTISGNEIYENDNAGIIFRQSSNCDDGDGCDMDGNTVTDNDIHDNGQYGLYFDSWMTARETPVVVSDNTIDTNGCEGMYVDWDTAGITISGNNITNNGWSCDDGEISTGIHTNSIEQISVHNNTISGNDAGVVNNFGGELEDGSTALDARQNWWGAADGPSDEGSGTGDTVGPDILFDPWYVNSGRTILSTAISGDTVDATEGDLELPEAAEGEVGLPSGTSLLSFDDDSVLDLSTSVKTMSDDGNTLILGGETISLADFTSGDLADINLLTARTVGDKEVSISKAIKLSSGSSGESIVMTNSALSGISVSIPDGTTILAPSGWTGTIQPPRAASGAGSAPSGFSVGGTVVEVGSPNAVILFDKPVLVLLSGVSGTVGYKPADSSTWAAINTACGGTYDAPTLSASAFPGECSISNGTDTKILTYHFTSFGSLTAASAATPARRGGNSAMRSSLSTTASTPSPATVAVSASSVPTPASVTPTTGGVSSATGQVLGTATFRFSGRLSVGSSGSEVTELQKRLIDEGVYSGPVTGYFGQLTKEAVKKFQAKYNIAQEGIIGPQTRSTLNGTATAATDSGGQMFGQVVSTFTRALRKGSRGEDVSALQKILTAEGFLAPENQTGYFGVLTESALKKYQEKNGLEAVGVAGPKTRAFLNSSK